jgi:hypothetical protein
VIYPANFTTLAVVNPALVGKILKEFTLPGTASILTPKDGTAQQWITSTDVTSILETLLHGNVTAMSGCNNLKVLFVKSELYNTFDDREKF